MERITSERIEAVCEGEGWQRTLAGLSLVDRLAKILDRVECPGDDPAQAPWRIVFEGPQIFDKGWLGGVLAGCQRDGVTMIGSERGGRAFVIGPTAAVEGEEPETLEAQAEQGRHPDDGFHQAVRTEADGKAALEALLLRTAKSTDSPLTQHLNRRISRVVTRWVLNTSVTPNQMTVATAGIGLVGAGFLASPHWSAGVFGAFLFQLSSWLDGCDGELARLKFQESKLGGWLDFLGDNVVHCAIFGAIAVGHARSTGALWPLVLGLVAMLGVVGAVVAVSYRQRGGGGSFSSVLGTNDPTVEEAVKRQLEVSDLLARRDFTYLILALAILGQLQWFLVFAAIGAPAYFVSLLVLYRRADGVQNG